MASPRAPTSSASAHSGKSSKPSYYQRHLSRLQAYQRAYAAGKRGRRKVSKKLCKSNKGCEGRDAEDSGGGVEGLASYTDTLAYRNGERDPERTYFMAVDEVELAARCTRLRDEYWLDEDDWRSKYIDDLQKLLDEHLERARERQSSPYDQPLAQYRALHSLRRLIAGLHQNIEIFAQGADENVLRTAQTRSLILDGCRLKKTVFKKLYGF
ncbi:hypothetical protein FA95DRAFT_1614194 [Auriscalpium vulgare]|uniref:Uncharacterized protein n=1 Tax=Auriscalpium vulgare TaxID=40419 RepID=A0ACB8R1P0_9AGAM|nr:hypothetical protein FA95DRAFT_1614194 [Auriscalpium vulgare]